MASAVAHRGVLSSFLALLSLSESVSCQRCYVPVWFCCWFSEWSKLRVVRLTFVFYGQPPQDDEQPERSLLDNAPDNQKDPKLLPTHLSVLH